MEQVACQAPHRSPQPPLVVFCETDAANGNAQRYADTLREHGYEFEWVGAGTAWSGWRTRMTLYLAELLKHDADRVVVLTDARDVLCVRSAALFMPAFESFLTPIVASAELTCQGRVQPPPPDRRWQCQPLDDYFRHRGVRHPPPRQFVNCGLVAGRAWALRKLLDWALEQGFQDDQYALGHFLNAFPHLCTLDVDARLLHTTVAAMDGGRLDNDAQLADSPSFSELMGLGAFFLHVPFGASVGQRLLWDAVVHATTHGRASERSLHQLYPHHPPPAWGEKLTFIIRD